MQNQDDFKKRPNIIYVSVGIEPKGISKGVIHIVGGPACFEALLDKQAE